MHSPLRPGMCSVCKECLDKLRNPSFTVFPDPTMVLGNAQPQGSTVNPSLASGVILNRLLSERVSWPPG